MPEKTYKLSTILKMCEIQFDQLSDVLKTTIEKELDELEHLVS